MIDIVTPLKNLFYSFKRTQENASPGLTSLSQLSLSQSDLATQQIEKPADEVQMILHALFENAAFSYLSLDQKRDLVDSFVRVELEENDVLFRQGDYGHYFYVVSEGECELYVRKRNKKAYKAATLQKGSNFGELALMYNGYRRATVVATGHTILYALDRHTFIKATKSNSELKTVFDKFATIIEDETNRIAGEEVQRYMDANGFIKAMTQHRDVLPQIDYEAEDVRLTAMFKMVDRLGNGLINFAEYALFRQVLSSPDPEFDLAFYYFDRNSENTISKSAFIDVLKTNIEADNPDNAFLNFECETVSRFFGQYPNERSLDFPEFAEFFIQFQIEYAQQLFLSYDYNKSGSIDAKVFIEITSLLGDPRAHLYSEHLCKSLMTPGTVSYAEFVGFQKFLQHLPAIKQLLRQTFQRHPNSSVNMNNFRAMMRNYSITTFSPIEARITFNMFGTNNYTVITADSFAQSSEVLHVNDDQLYRRPDGSIEMCENPQLLAANQSNQGSQIPTSFSPSVTSYPSLPSLTDIFSDPKKLLSNLCIASAASGLGAAAVFPIDAIKTRMQYNRCAPLVEGFYVYKNSFDCFRRTVKIHSVRGLYRGLLPVLVGVMPEKTIKIWVNHHLRIMFDNTSQNGINFPLEVLAGAVAGASQVLITNPMELIKIRMQLVGEFENSKKVKKIVQVKATGSSFKLIKQLKFSGLYTGLVPTLMRDIPFSAMYFPLYASLKERMSDPIDGLSFEGLLLAGAGAVVPAAFLTTPMDVIKTRMQALPITTDDWRLNKELKYRTVGECVAKIRKHEGMSAFFKGAGSRVCFWSPQFAVTLLGYELMLQAFAPDLQRVPPTHVPVTENDISVISNAENVRNQLTRMDHELKILR